MTTSDDLTSLHTGEADAELDALLSRELDRHNFAATGIDDQRELTVAVRDDAGEVVAGLSGWTWGQAAGIGMVWVRDDQRGRGRGTQLLEAAEAEARRRGCTQVTVSSFTFQAPAFYERHGYVEFARTEGIPVPGRADVHFRKDLD